MGAALVSWQVCALALLNFSLSLVILSPVPANLPTYLIDSRTPSIDHLLLLEYWPISSLAKRSNPRSGSPADHHSRQCQISYKPFAPWNYSIGRYLPARSATAIFRFDHSYPFCWCRAGSYGCCGTISHIIATFALFLLIGLQTRTFP